MRVIQGILGLALLAFCGPVASLPQQDRDYSRPGSHDRTPAEQRVDINHASVEQLMKVPGMTRPWAERIVRYRPYRTKQDLIDQGIITGEVYQRIRDSIIAHRDKE